MSTTTDKLRILTPKVIVKYLKNHKKRGIDTVWMFQNVRLPQYNVNFNEIRSRGNKYSVLLKLRNYILKESYYNDDIFEKGSLSFSSYYMDEKDDTIYNYIYTYFFSSSDLSLLKMIKVPKKLKYT
uniref:Uncharacterized protein n=1 Tax=Pithovirus LCPAC001 TaxID=2506585 RepID=A0A481Z4Y6_9VIRU|nr:MAG: hypothetical protein LCPAC001_02130 [Pithovirus LCPAC001]